MIQYLMKILQRNITINNYQTNHMKKTILYIFAMSTMITACKKDTVKTAPLASLNIVNAVVNGAALTLNNTGASVFNNSNMAFTINAGQSQINLFDPANPAKPYYDETVPTNNGEYASLFLSGSSPSAVDAVLIKETYKNYVDSLFGVRFINLSPGSSPISVNIEGGSNGSEVQSLAYKAYGSFKQYPGKKVNTSYTFEIRDAATGTLEESYTLPSIPRFHNITIALIGLPASRSVLQVNHF